MHQWFTLDEVKQKQKACPLSIGQAEAGRYTFCIGEQCMAWKWNEKQVKEAKENLFYVHKDEVAEGWEIASPENEDGFVDTMKKPTHGRCGMVP